MAYPVLGETSITPDMTTGSFYCALKRCAWRLPVKNHIGSWALVSRTCNLTYSGGREQEDPCSKPVWANSS
jgi:hypothetical protein